MKGKKNKRYSSDEEFWKDLQRFFDLHYRPPKVNETVVNELVRDYKQKHPEEFPNLKKSLPKGYPVNTPANLPPS